MRKILITPYGKEHKETFHNNQMLLNYLEIMAKETKCRKKCRCSFCKRDVFPGEMAMKTTQKITFGYHYNAYCSDCYQIRGENDEV